VCVRACVTGILWINNKDKLVVAGFTPGSQAKQAGVLCGDILRKVDGQDVLKMKSEVQA
jgi:S1-C subfamily serine protease